jgi:hypothetical protein
MTRSFPAIGFDPAPGDLGAVRAAVQSMGDVARELVPCAEQMNHVLHPDSWTGTAADGFRAAGADIPRSLVSGANSLSRAGQALMTWAGQLSVNQIHADELERQMAAANAAQATEEAAMWRTWPGGDPTSGQTPPPAYQRAAAACRHAYDTGNAVYAKAVDLLAKHTAQATTAAAAIRGAGGNQPFEPTQHESGIMQVVDTLTSIAGYASQAFGTLAQIAAVFPPADEVAGGLETLATGSGGVASLGGVTQVAAGSPDAPSGLQLLIANLPGRGLGGAVNDGRALARATDGGARSLPGALGGKTRAGLADRSRTLGGQLSEQAHVTRGRHLAHGDARAAAATGAATIAQAAAGQSDNPYAGLAGSGIGVVVNPTRRQVGKAALNAGALPW